MKQHAIITGAGTGVGRHTAIALAKAGWALTLNGRTLSTLEETQKSCQANGTRCHIVAGSIAQRGFAAQLIQEAIQTHGAVGVLCNAAGTNTPRRMLEELSEEDYHRLIDTNLHGSYDAIQAILPSMREARSGTIINIISDSALWGMPLAGAAYTVSKFGLRGLTQTINAEENKHGIRACGILPGEIDTPILKQRPTMPTEAHRATMLRPEDVAECVMLAVNLPPRAVVQELLIRPCR